MNRILLISFILFFSMFAHAQLGMDSIPATKSLKNTIHLNFSQPIFFGEKNIILGYERVINKRQSFSINIGTAVFPDLVSDERDSTRLIKANKNGGYNLSGDFRFYLTKINKVDAPRGVYVGPYISYVHYTDEQEWEIRKANEPSVTAKTDSWFNIFSIGAELGYQFVFWRRLAVDLVLLGPGISHYHLNCKAIGPLISEEEKDQIRERFQQAIEDKFPGTVFVFKGHEINKEGTLRTWELGFRYIVHIGFRF